MKKIACLVAVCVAIAIAVAAFFLLRPTEAKETISVYNWGDYMDTDVLKTFTEETGIEVIYEVFETNEDMYAKIANGGASYDIIIPSDYMIERMIQEQLLQPVNWDNIPNVANIDPRFMNEGYDPQSA